MMADQNSNEPNFENDKPEDSVGSIKTGTRQGKSSRSSSESKRGLSLPPELVSKRHPVSDFRQTVITITQPNKYLLVVVLLILSLGIGFLGGWLGSSSQQNSVNNQSIFDSKQTVVSSQSQAIAAVAKEVNPSVVSITATQTTASTTSLFGLGTGAGSSEDAGTGIILSANGLIITNHHVIPDGTTSVSVTLSDGTTYNNVQIVGTTSDSSSLDIGFLKIDNLDGRKLVPVVNFKIPSPAVLSRVMVAVFRQPMVPDRRRKI
jgi:hypothetical protein